MGLSPIHSRGDEDDDEAQAASAPGQRGYGSLEYEQRMVRHAQTLRETVTDPDTMRELVKEAKAAVPLGLSPAVLRGLRDRTEAERMPYLNAPVKSGVLEFDFMHSDRGTVVDIADRAYIAAVKETRTWGQLRELDSRLYGFLVPAFQRLLAFDAAEESDEWPDEAGMRRLAATMPKPGDDEEFPFSRLFDPENSTDWETDTMIEPEMFDLAMYWFPDELLGRHAFVAADPYGVRWLEFPALNENWREGLSFLKPDAPAHQGRAVGIAALIDDLEALGFAVGRLRTTPVPYE